MATMSFCINIVYKIRQFLLANHSIKPKEEKKKASHICVFRYLWDLAFHYHNRMNCCKNKLMNIFLLC